MDCTGCIWLHPVDDENYCIKRDTLKQGETDMQFQKTPGYGCDGKTIVISNSAGSKIVVTGAQTLIPFPSGYGE